MFDQYKNIHCVGVGGIGLSALTKLFLLQGKEVSGSDIEQSKIVSDIEYLGLKFKKGHESDYVTEQVDLLIYSPAVPETNPERMEARKRGIQEYSYPEALGELSKIYTTIAVSGMHGKTTTTAMVASILIDAGYDPTVIVGSYVPSFKHGNVRKGGGRFLVVEACEYRAHMLNLHPEMVILTNLEEEHMDYYKDINHICQTFQSFVGQLKGQGLVVMNKDNENLCKLEVQRPIFFSTKAEADYRSSDRKITNGIQEFQVEQGNQNMGSLELSVPGEFNVSNALAATAAAMELGVPFETCKQTLKIFAGTWRRFEYLGEWKGANIVSDYAHHPTEIRSTLKAARELYPKRRIVLCFQPHQHNRTKELMEDFAESFEGIDQIIVSEIYDVAGRNEDHDVSASQLVERIQKEQPDASVVFGADLEKTKEILEQTVMKNDLIIFMGAGSIDDLARDL